MNRRAFLLILLAAPVAFAKDEDAQKKPKPTPINPPGSPQPRPKEKPREAGDERTRAER